MTVLVVAVLRACIIRNGHSNCKMTHTVFDKQWGMYPANDHVCNITDLYEVTDSSCQIK